MGLISPIPCNPHACQVKPQFGQRVGVLPARSASKPMGKAQIATTIAQVGKLPWLASELHFGQLTCAMNAPYVPRT
jgi:hypothetical protein